MSVSIVRVRSLSGNVVFEGSGWCNVHAAVARATGWSASEIRCFVGVHEIEGYARSDGGILEVSYVVDAEVHDLLQFLRAVEEMRKLSSLEFASWMQGVVTTWPTRVQKKSVLLRAISFSKNGAEVLRLASPDLLDDLDVKAAAVRAEISRGLLPWQARCSVDYMHMSVDVMHLSPPVNVQPWTVVDFHGHVSIFCGFGRVISEDSKELDKRVCSLRRIYSKDGRDCCRLGLKMPKVYEPRVVSSWSLRHFRRQRPGKDSRVRMC